jgi:hypothetical protein
LLGHAEVVAVCPVLDDAAVVDLEPVGLGHREGLARRREDGIDRAVAGVDGPGRGAWSSAPRPGCRRRPRGGCRSAGRRTRRAATARPRRTRPGPEPARRAAGPGCRGRRRAGGTRGRSRPGPRRPWHAGRVPPPGSGRPLRRRRSWRS